MNWGKLWLTPQKQEPEKPARSWKEFLTQVDSDHVRIPELEKRIKALEAQLGRPIKPKRR